MAVQKSQLAMLYEQQQKIGARDRAMMDMIHCRENPMTRRDLDALIQRRPNVYSRYAGLRRHLPEQARHPLAELQAIFATEEACGIYYASVSELWCQDEIAYLPSHEEMGRCTNCAWYVVDRLNEGDVWGFLSEDNPTATHREIAGSGHDFAVIGNRYIVDIWISLYTGSESQVVYDLVKPEDGPNISAIFGDPSCWVRFDPVTRNIARRSRGSFRTLTQS